MNPLQMVFGMFAAGALGGVSLALMGGLGVRYPRWFGAAHGVLGLLACALLAWVLWRAEGAVPVRAAWALAVLVAALGGGFVLFRLLAVRRARRLLALGHGALAGVGLYLLYGAAF